MSQSRIFYLYFFMLSGVTSPYSFTGLYRATAQFLSCPLGKKRNGLIQKWPVKGWVFVLNNFSVLWSRTSTKRVVMCRTEFNRCLSNSTQVIIPILINQSCTAFNSERQARKLQIPSLIYQVRPFPTLYQLCNRDHSELTKKHQCFYCMAETCCRLSE